MFETIEASSIDGVERLLKKFQTKENVEKNPQKLHTFSWLIGKTKEKLCC